MPTGAQHNDSFETITPASFKRVLGSTPTHLINEPFQKRDEATPLSDARVVARSTKRTRPHP